MDEIVENNEIETEETIEETDQGTDAPDDENADNVDDPTVDDPTSEKGDNDGAEDENFFGTFKTKEDADKGFKSAQAKITEQANRIKELEALQKKADAPTVPNVDQEVKNVTAKVNAEFGERLRGLGVKYSSYIPNDVQINTIDDIVANLPPQDASKFTAELIAIQNDCNGKLQKEINSVHENAKAKYEEIKNADKERYKDNEIVFNAWYNPPETIEGVAELVENVRKQAIEDYIKEQTAKKEDEQHKSKLSTNVNSSSKKFNEGHIFTRAEIGKMKPSEFAKWEAEISRQVAEGLIVE